MTIGIRKHKPNDPHHLAVVHIEDGRWVCPMLDLAGKRCAWGPVKATVRDFRLHFRKTHPDFDGFLRFEQTARYRRGGRARFGTPNSTPKDIPAKSGEPPSIHPTRSTEVDPSPKQEPLNG